MIVLHLENELIFQPPAIPLDFHFHVVPPLPLLGLPKMTENILPANTQLPNSMEECNFNSV